jgi:hypothetical protein
LRKIPRFYALCLIPVFAALAHAQSPAPPGEGAAPLAFGETFTIDSKVLGETRRINVYAPPGYK